MQSTRLTLGFDRSWVRIERPKKPVEPVRTTLRGGYDTGSSLSRAGRGRTGGCVSLSQSIPDPSDDPDMFPMRAAMPLRVDASNSWIKGIDNSKSALIFACNRASNRESPPTAKKSESLLIDFSL